MATWLDILGILFLVFVVAPIVFIVALVKLPKPMPERWEIRLFLLLGMPANQFLGYVIQNGVDPVFWHRAMYATYISMMNMCFWIPAEEEAFPTEMIEKTEIKHPPIFILGHFRSGTSLLHELMNKDPRLIAPNVFQCYTPRIFLGREEYLQRKFPSFKITRPMDKMTVGLTSAFEDEFALANLSGLSPYMGAIYPRQYHYYERYLTFRECSKEEVDTWKKTVLFFFKKVLLRNQDKRLISKSPSHTARVKLLRELFPGARFVHISRNPYEIYQSTHKLHEKLLYQWCLQRPPIEDTNWRSNVILNHFRKMYEAYFEDIKQLSSSEIVDVKYTDLVAAPMKVIEDIYKQLGIEGFEGVRPAIEQYEKDQQAGGFRVNTHNAISAEEKKLIEECWAQYFDYYGYEKMP